MFKLTLFSKPTTINKQLVLLLVFTMMGSLVYGTTKTSNKTGNWSDPTMWTPSGVPSSTDNVVIHSGNNVTVDGNYTCANLDLGDATNSASTLSATLGNSLTINGDLRINPSNKRKDYYLDAGAGTINIAGTFSYWGTLGTNNLQVGVGTLNITPAVSITNNKQYVIFTDAGTINFQSSFSDTKNRMVTVANCNAYFYGAYNISSTATTWGGYGTAYFMNGSSITPTTNITFNNVQVWGASTTLNAGAGTVDVGGDFTMYSGATFTMNDDMEVDGNWANNGGTLSAGTHTVIFNGATQTIGGTSSTTFGALQMGTTTNSATACTINYNTTCSSVTFPANTKAASLALGSGVLLTVTGNVTINQPTGAATKSLDINDGICSVGGNLVFTGTNNTTSRIAEVDVTSGSFSLTGSVTWMSNTAVATEVISVNTGTLTFRSSLTMGSGSGTLAVSSTGTVNFNGTSAPSFNFGGASTSPIFTTTAGCTLNFKAGFTNSTNALVLPYPSTAIFTGSGTITPSAAITFASVQIEPSATLTLGGNIAVLGDWTNNGTFTPNSKTVSFSAASPNTQTIYSGSGTETFYAVTLTNAGATLALSSDVKITSALTMSGPNIDLNNHILTLGNGSGATLARSAGIAYGGTWKRWLPVTAITSTSGSYYGLIPIGTSTAYRPVAINTTSNPTTAGYILASHTDSLTVSSVSYTDNEGASIQAISDMYTTLSTSGLAGGTYKLAVTNTGFANTGAISDLKLETHTGGTMGSYGTTVTTTGTVPNVTATRSGLTATNLSNIWVIGTKNKTNTPIRSIYYSRKTGNWTDVTTGNGTWATSSGGVSCNCLPTSSSYVIIDNNYTVTINANETVDMLDIKDGATLKDNGTATLTVNQNLTTYGTGRFLNTSTWNITGNLTLSSSSISTATGTMGVTGLISVPLGGSFTQSAGILNILGNLDLQGTMTLGSGTYSLKGIGATLSGNGSIVGTSGSTLVIPNAKTILAGSNLTFGTSGTNLTVSLSGATTVTNNGTVKINGNLTGSLATSTWVNGTSSSLEVTGSVMTTGIFNASASPNTVIYSGTGAQTIKVPLLSYYDLQFTNAGTKTLGGDVTVNNSVTISGNAVLAEGSNALSGGGGLTMTGNSQLTMDRTSNGTFPELTGTYNLTGGTITINATNRTPVVNGVTYNNLVLTGSRSFDLSNVSNIGGDLTISGTGKIANNIGLTVAGTLNYSTTGISTLSQDMILGGFNQTAGTFKDGGNTITINGDGGWQNNGGTFTATGYAIFSGTSAQQIGGSQATSFNNLLMNNHSGVTLNVSPAAPTVVQGLLYLNDGVINTSATNILRMVAGSTTSAGSAISYVSGPMVKVGNTDFTFPVGKSGRYAAAAISGLQKTTTEVQCEYVYAPYTDTSTLSGSLATVSHVEYWLLDRTVTNDSLILALNWQDASLSTMSNCSGLTIAHYKAGAWREEPASVTFGSACSGSGDGTMQTTGYISSFSPFTFGSNDGGSLPITLVSYDAKVDDQTVLNQWTTAMEINNDYFSIERSADGVNFEEVGQVKGAGNSSNTLQYEFVDQHPLSGVSYYRLRQTDFDGRFTYSKTVAVNFANGTPSKESSITLYPNPTNDKVFLNIQNPTEQMQVSFYDMAGRQVYTQTFAGETNSANQVIGISTRGILNQGLYIATVQLGDQLLTEKLMVKE